MTMSLIYVNPDQKTQGLFPDHGMTLIRPGPNFAASLPVDLNNNLTWTWLLI